MSVNIIRLLQELSLCVLSLKFQIFFSFLRRGDIVSTISDLVVDLIIFPGFGVSVF